MGAPSTYTDTLATEICEWLANGGTLAAYCRIEGNPAHRTVHDWRKANKAFADRYEEAMLHGCHALLDETLSIADGLEEDAASRRVRIWSRHELVKRKRPDVFSDKVQLQHSGSIQNLSDDEVEARYMALLQKVGSDAGGETDDD